MRHRVRILAVVLQQLKVQPAPSIPDPGAHFLAQLAKAVRDDYYFGHIALPICGLTNLTRLSPLAPNNPPGGRFFVVGSCKVGTTWSAVITISECRPT